MFRPALLIVPFAAAAAVLATAAHAQTMPLPPAPPYYAMEPTMPLTPHANSPVQQQILENYRSQLLETQREQMQQNPSGLGRSEIEVNRQLNAVGPGYRPVSPSATSNPAPIASFNAAPFSAPGALPPAPPFDAAPPPTYPAAAR